ncbi:MAG: type II secretion system F family protein [Lachnospiraceae bacterium]|nr:type II secretion system F family protein [Lachnospiraceae bacterium]
MKNKIRPSRLLVPEGKLRDAMELYPGKTREEVRELLYAEVKKKLLPGLAAAVFFLAMAIVTGRTPAEEGILRPAPGKEPLSIQVQVSLEDDVTSLPISVGALEYEEDRIEELHREAEEYLCEVVSGENESLEKVTEDLFFPATLPGTGGEISWSSDNPRLVTAKGEVLNRTLEVPEQVEITAKISYGSEQRMFSRVLTVYPAVFSEKELLLQQVQEELITLEQGTRTQERFFLPGQVLGHPVWQEEASGFSAAGFLVLLAVAVPLLLYSGYFGSLDTKRKERKEQAEGCYSEFVTKLSLLLAAGNSVRQAFVRLAAEYEKNHGPKHVLASELKVTKQELENGRSETVVYEDFGRRIGVLAYRRMASLLTQSVSRGVQGMRNLLLQEAKEVMAQEKAHIRQKGEQAGTKLLLPMMGMLFLVFAILLVPAFQSF